MNLKKIISGETGNVAWDVFSAFISGVVLGAVRAIILLIHFGLFISQLKENLNLFYLIAGPLSFFSLWIILFRFKELKRIILKSE